MEPLILLRSVGKSYPTSRNACPALRDINLEIRPGELVAVMGKRRRRNRKCAAALEGAARRTQG